jgi:hypothetical protein
MKDQQMKKSVVGSLSVAAILWFAPVAHAQFASAVISYDSGTGFIPGYTTADSALGAPTVFTPGPYGGPVDPFDPPYLPEQVVSVGAGGSITLQMSAPIFNNPANPFGLDFNIFGNSGFVIINGDYSGGGITDGSLLGNNSGATRVEVSQDGNTWYVLDPTLAPTVDGFYPTDGSGNPQVAVNPALTSSDFAGLGLSGIRSLYAGSAGGTGYDLSWARDSYGYAVGLSSASYVRIDVLSGTSEIDGIAAVPEPSGGALALVGLGLIWWAGSKAQLRAGRAPLSRSSEKEWGRLVPTKIIETHGDGPSPLRFGRAQRAPTKDKFLA